MILLLYDFTPWVAFSAHLGCGKLSFLAPLGVNKLD